MSGFQNFLNIRKGWDDIGTVIPGDTYETMWINDTLVASKDDTQLTGKLDSGLYLFFYGVEGAGLGNDLTATPAFSAVPFVVHVDEAQKGASPDQAEYARPDR